MNSAVALSHNILSLKLFICNLAAHKHHKTKFFACDQLGLNNLNPKDI